MNSFATDMRRALCSGKFLTGLAAELLILFLSGPESELFCLSIPLICTIPYSVSVLNDMQSGFIKSYLPRTNVNSYIRGKALATMLSGGLIEILPALIYGWYTGSHLPQKLFVLMGGSVLSPDYPSGNETEQLIYGLIFLSGAFWALFALTCTKLTENRYVAYGSAFVFYYILIIIVERYLKDSYCLNPKEWFMFQHKWEFGQVGVVIMLGLGMVILYRIFESSVKKSLQL